MAPLNVFRPIVEFGIVGEVVGAFVVGSCRSWLSDITRADPGELLTIMYRVLGTLGERNYFGLAREKRHTVQLTRTP